MSCYSHRDHEPDCEWCAKARVRELCEHDFGGLCYCDGFGGCFRECTKCRQIVGLGGKCWEMKEKRERKALETGSEDK